MASEDTYPLFLHRLAEVASIITDPKFKRLVNSSIHNAPWIPHQLLFNIQNYFESLTLIATNPSALRNVATEQGSQKYNLKEYMESERQYKAFHDALRACIACSSLGVFQYAPKTYYDFFFI